MIKILSVRWVCKTCGSEVFSEREIVIDNYLKKIEVTKPKTCQCGTRNKETFVLRDIKINKLEEVKK